MTLTIAQSSRYRGKDQWDWSVWLEGRPAELDEVESVTWFLHSTFKNPVREHTNREQKFRLDASGWGGFELQAEIRRRTGRTLRRSHELVLEYPEEASEESAGARRHPAKGDPPRVFVAASMVDRTVTAALMEGLEKAGMRASTEAALDAAVPVTVSIEKALRSSDAVIAVFSDRTSRFVIDEVNHASRLGIPILPVVVGRRTKLPKSVQHVQAIYIDDPDEAANAAPQAAQSIQALLR